MASPSKLFHGLTRTVVRRALGVRRPHVLIACMPKSASTFLADALAELPGMRRVDLSWAMGRREQTLDVVQLARRDLSRYVCQQHLRYSEDVGELIEEFRLTPVVLTRNLFDAVASVRDHFRDEGPKFPMTTLGPEHAKLSDAELEDLIADLVVPWYVSFYVSWQGVDCLRTTYDEVRESPREVVASICRRARIEAGVEEIARAVDAARAKGRRLNKGISGRGQTISLPARDKIVALTRHFPKIDFAPVGVSNAMREVAHHA
jgi:hypothetical protein